MKLNFKRLSSPWLGFAAAALLTLAAFAMLGSYDFSMARQLPELGGLQTLSLGLNEDNPVVTPPSKVAKPTQPAGAKATDASKKSNSPTSNPPAKNPRTSNPPTNNPDPTSTPPTNQPLPVDTTPDPVITPPITTPTDPSVDLPPITTPPITTPQVTVPSVTVQTPIAGVQVQDTSLQVTSPIIDTDVSVDLAPVNSLLNSSPK